MEQAGSEEVSVIRTNFLSEPLPSEQEAELFINGILESQEKFDGFKVLLKSINIEPNVCTFLEKIDTNSYQGLKDSPLIEPEIRKIYLQLYDPRYFEFICQRIRAGEFTQAETLSRLYELTWGVIMLVLAEQNKIKKFKLLINGLRITTQFKDHLWHAFFNENPWLINMPLFVVSSTNNYFTYMPTDKPLSINTPLMATTGLQTQAMAQWFIEQGALIDGQNSLGHSVFIWFLRYKFLDCAYTNFAQYERWIRWFLERKADINLPNYLGETVLEDAIMSKKTLLTGYLVECGADCSIVNALDGQTLLMKAAEHNLYAEVNFLIGLGADPEAVNYDGKRASELTTDYNVQLLLCGWEEIKKNERELALEEVPCGFERCDIDDFIFAILEKMLKVPEDKRLRIFLQSTHRSASIASSLFNNLIDHKLLIYVRKRLAVLKENFKEVDGLVEVLHWCSDSLVRKKLGYEGSLELDQLMHQIYHEKIFNSERLTRFIEKNQWLINSPLSYKTETKTSTETLLVHALYAQNISCIEFLVHEAQVDTDYPSTCGYTPKIIAEKIEDQSVKVTIQELLLRDIEH